MLVVPRTPTPQALASLPALVDAGFGAHGSRITSIQRANLAALLALETDRGRAIQNGNVGNLSAGAAYAGPVWRPPWFEIDESSNPKLRALHERMLAGTAPSAFRSYDSVEQGAADFARLLLTPGYTHLLDAAAGTDADAFRRALAERYSPDYANPKATAALASLARGFGLSTAGSGGVAIAVLGFALWYWSRRMGRRLAKPGRGQKLRPAGPGGR